MNFVFLSPHFPPNYKNFCRSLKAAGFNALGIGDAEFGDLDPELARSLAWYYKVSDMHNYEELREACRFFIEKFGAIDGIDSLNEYWLETEAALRTEFGIHGIKNDTIADIRRKSRMKLVFAAAGIPHARGAIVGSPAEAKAFAKEVYFPIIVKPDDGMGASFTYKLHDDAEVDSFFSEKPEREFIAEEFIAGDIVTFDGLAGRNGEIIFCTSHAYDQGVMEAVLADSHIYYYSLREIPADIEKAGRRLVEGFKVRERFFHFEFFRTKNGTLFALEVNIRPPGGFTLDMFNYSCDIDMYAVWARMMAGEEVRLDYARRYFCCYAGRKYRLPYRYSHEELLRLIGPLVVFYQELPPVLARAMGDCGYILRAEKLDDLLEAVRLIQSVNQ
ncbi:MAG TPA: carboxylate--amine ligase [Elusimicrobia bacterium]|nr:MAG: carboxylate--amine ligase [Elusimicrobia bacterium GWF2_62_30]HBA60792.1 carboxylate--amine ligase [Elusimicrobiota bacterium]